jgi:HPt (histidine-containing phosphotransfer) domain-containing protein
MLGRWLAPRVPVTSPNIASSIVAEAPPAPAATATLDVGTIAKIRRIPGEDGSSLLRQVVSRFAANAGPLMADIRAKARNSDPEAMWRAAHSLRSSAASIGACRVAQSCAEIEALARENGILPTEAVLAALESELSAAMRELSQLAEAEPDMLGAESVVGN